MQGLLDISMMLHYVIVKTVELVGLTGCTRQAALERQDLSCMYLAHHELESVLIIIIIITTIIIILADNLAVALEPP